MATGHRRPAGLGRGAVRRFLLGTLRCLLARPRARRGSGQVGKLAGVLLGRYRRLRPRGRLGSCGRLGRTVGSVVRSARPRGRLGPRGRLRSRGGSGRASAPAAPVPAGRPTQQRPAPAAAPTRRRPDRNRFSRASTPGECSVAPLLPRARCLGTGGRLRARGCIRRSVGRFGRTRGRPPLPRRDVGRVGDPLGSRPSRQGPPRRRTAERAALGSRTGAGAVAAPVARAGMPGLVR